MSQSRVFKICVLSPLDFFKTTRMEKSRCRILFDYTKKAHLIYQTAFQNLRNKSEFCEYYPIHRSITKSKSFYIKFYGEIRTIFISLHDMRGAI